jgi:hypothetical protein
VLEKIRGVWVWIWLREEGCFKYAAIPSAAPISTQPPIFQFSPLPETQKNPLEGSGYCLGFYLRKSEASHGGSVPR